MSWLPNWFFAVSPLAWAIVVLLTAFGLVVFGWWGRRVGREPRCRGCGYELTGLQSANCPECGRVEVMKRPRIGVRRRRWGFVGSGAVVLLAIAATAVWMWRDSTWRMKAPAPILALAAELGDNAAEIEIDRRIASDGFSAWELRFVIGRMLEAVRKNAADADSRFKWMYRLGSIDSNDQLTDAEWETLNDLSVRNIRVKLRTRTRVGDVVPVMMEADFLERAADFDGRVRLRSDRAGSRNGAWVDAELSAVSGLHIAPDLRGKLAASVPHDLPVGRHTVIFEFEGTPSTYTVMANYGPLGIPARRSCIRPSRRTEAAELLAALNHARSSFTPSVTPAALRESLFTLRHTFEAEIEVFPADSDGDLVPVRGAETVGKLRSILRFRSVSGMTDLQRYSGGLELQLLEPPPWPIEFDAYLYRGSQRVLWGTICARSGQAPAWDNLSSGAVARFEAGPMWVELVPSAKFNRGLLDPRFADEQFTLGPVDFVPHFPNAAWTPATQPSP